VQRIMLLLAVAAIAAVAMAASAVPALAQSRGSPSSVQLQSPSAATCPPANQVLYGVWEPGRLSVLNPCQTVSGTVKKMFRASDGDVHFQLIVDQPYRYLLNAANANVLVVELMPRDGGHLPAPPIGSYVVLTGAWVTDEVHGWNELHPVWSESINGGPVYRSGPQYVGTPPQSSWGSAVASCRTERGAVCVGYPGIPVTGLGPP
jgi:hypothetical protein